MAEDINLDSLNDEVHDSSKLYYNFIHGGIYIWNKKFNVNLFENENLIKISDFRNTPFYLIEKIEIEIELELSFENKLIMFLNIKNISDWKNHSSSKFEETCKRLMKINNFT